VNLKTDLNAPIDSLQKVSLEQIDTIRGWVGIARQAVALWEPGPMPPDWQDHE